MCGWGVHTISRVPRRPICGADLRSRFFHRFIWAETLEIDLNPIFMNYKGCWCFERRKMDKHPRVIAFGSGARAHGGRRGRGLSLRGLSPTHRKNVFSMVFNGFRREMKASDKVKRES